MRKEVKKVKIKFASIYLKKEMNLKTKQEYYTPVIEFAKSKELQKIMVEYHCLHAKELAIELNLHEIDLNKLKKEKRRKRNDKRKTKRKTKQVGQEYCCFCDQ